MRTQMYMNKFTQIDHAYIDEQGRVIGGSYNLSCIVSGPVEEHEQVVIDFSACKKRIKELVDDDAHGFDHKLWIIEGISKYDSANNYSLKTPAIEINNEQGDCFKYIRNDTEYGEVINAVQEAIGTYLNEQLGMEFFGVSVEVYLDEDFIINNKLVSNETLHPIRYVHGLRNSSSYGCNNIAHGHLSYYTGSEVSQLCYVFVYEENVIQYNCGDDPMMRIKYDTEDRGTMYMAVNAEMHNVVVFPHETTIENLVNSDMFNACEFMSEGLAKGAIRNS